jgi:hypothetical protein
MSDTAMYATIVYDRVLIPNWTSTFLSNLMSIPITTFLLFFVRATPIIRIRSIHMRRHYTTMPPHLLVLQLDESLRPIFRDGLFVTEYKQRCVADEDAVDIFEGPTRGFGVEEVHCVEVRIC